MFFEKGRVKVMCLVCAMSEVNGFWWPPGEHYPLGSQQHMYTAQSIMSGAQTRNHIERKVGHIPAAYAKNLRVSIRDGKCNRRKVHTGWMNRSHSVQRHMLCRAYTLPIQCRTLFILLNWCDVKVLCAFAVIYRVQWIRCSMNSRRYF